MNSADHMMAMMEECVECENGEEIKTSHVNCVTIDANWLQTIVNTISTYPSDMVPTKVVSLIRGAFAVHINS